MLVDGQPWRGSGQDELTMDLSDGRHNIQIRKAGFVGYLTDVEIRKGETISLNVEPEDAAASDNERGREPLLFCKLDLQSLQKAPDTR